ncbi:MAG TPA: hypothetical protein VG317_10410 [Pseudonocardiaceae bacterium]|nr:hypothetical protein [Pseudonocardiaceae bacterium]
MWTASGVAVAASLAVGLLAGCSGGQPAGANPRSAAGVVSQLGAVPIPSVATGPPAPVLASIGHPQLLAMGAPVLVTLPGGKALITTNGPTENLSPGGVNPNAPVPGRITVTATASAGTVQLAAADLASLDENGHPIDLAPIGAASVFATPGHPATLRLSGTFHTGEAQINWRQDGHVIAMWDFTIETD